MRKALWIAAALLVLVAPGCDNPAADVNVTSKEFHELPTGFWHSKTMGMIQIQGTAEQGGTIVITNSPSGDASGTWKLAGPGAMEVTMNSQTFQVPFSRGGGLELEVTWPSQPKETWIEQ